MDIVTPLGQLYLIAIYLTQKFIITLCMSVYSFNSIKSDNTLFLEHFCIRRQIYQKKYHNKKLVKVCHYIMPGFEHDKSLF